MTSALYAFDTLKLNECWQLSGGLRYEHYQTKTDARMIVTASNAATFPGYAVGQLAPTNVDITDNLLSWKVGALFKPTANGSIYAAVANSLTPPGGGNFALSATSTNQNNASMDPQETSNIEQGTKWDLLNVSGAICRTENDKQVSFNQDTSTFSRFGKTRVEGVELAAVGQITNFWQVSVGIAKMRTKALDQASRNSSGVVSESDGVRWSPDLTASLWTSVHPGWRRPLRLRAEAGGHRRHRAGDLEHAEDSVLLGGGPDGRLQARQEHQPAAERLQPVRQRLYQHPQQRRARMALGVPRSASRSAEFQF